MSATSPQVAQRLRRIQNTLGVTADGMLGPETLTALEKRLELGATRKTVSLTCSRKSLELIVQFEIGSRAQYERLYAAHVAGRRERRHHRHWLRPRVHIEDADRSGLGSISREARARRARRGAGRQGRGAAATRARPAPHQDSSDRSGAGVLRQHAAALRANHARRFPGRGKVPLDAQGALLSLVFNRGASLTGERRSEMRAIRDELAAGRASLERIADHFEDMQRLWPDARGLRERRVREAALVRGARRRYLAGEKVDV